MRNRWRAYPIEIEKKNGVRRFRGRSNFWKMGLNHNFFNYVAILANDTSKCSSR